MLSCQSGTLDNITLQTNLHDQVSLYLSQVQNAISLMSVSPTTASRSIRKISISGSPEEEDSSWRRQEDSEHKVVVEVEDGSWRRQEDSEHKVVVEKEDSSWRRQEEDSSWRRQEELDHRVVVEEEDGSWRRQEELDHRVVVEEEDSSWRRQEELDHRVVSMGPGPGRPPCHSDQKHLKTSTTTTSAAPSHSFPG
eukprot:XP_014035969.1 PREDICTED: golgin subfamily A member 6-like protein 22 isoform X3 [Salmo salar]